MNNPLRKFLDFVSSDFSLDYWADEAIDEAIGMACDLSLNDFNELSSNWSRYDIKTTVRIAEIFSEIDQFHEIRLKILMQMIEGGQEDIVEASIDSINSIIQMDKDISSVMRNEILITMGSIREELKDSPILVKIKNNIISLL